MKISALALMLLCHWAFAQQIVFEKKFPNGQTQSRLLKYGQNTHILHNWDKNGNQIISTWVDGIPHSLEVKTNRNPPEHITFTSPKNNKAVQKFDQNLSPKDFNQRSSVTYFSDYKKIEHYQFQNQQFKLISEKKEPYQVAF